MSLHIQERFPDILKPAAEILRPASKILRPAGMLLKPASRILTDAVFPRRCPVCGEIVPLGTPGGICAACLPKLDLVKGAVCMKCGRELSDASEKYCSDCRKRPKSFAYGCALCNYDDIMQHAVTRIKYANRREYIAPLAGLFAACCADVIRGMDADCLVPVPIHPERRRRRGFNQAELLAEALGGRLGIPVRTDILFRSRRTEPQKELSPDERIRNLLTAFSAPEGAAAGLDVILVDDIYTTGSTIEACTRVLQRAGAGKVYFLALCIVPEA